MSITNNDILIKNDFIIDGEKSVVCSNEISYSGTISSSFDVTIYGEDVDTPIPLGFNGVIKKIIMTNESCGDLTYKINDIDEDYLLRTQAILSQQPTSIKVTNTEDVNKVIRIKIIGEEN